jgi:selT/selW/selH-like putative selenoprotein
VSKIITTINPDTVIDGNKNTPRTGSFEVELDGKIVFSKFQTGKFPSESEIKSWF